jgi:hypothetical protein
MMIRVQLMCLNIRDVTAVVMVALSSSVHGA